MTAFIFTAARQLQAPLLAAFLLSACVAKLLQALRSRSLRAVLEATELFRAGLRLPAAVAVCVAETTLGAALILTIRADGVAAGGVRVATSLFFLVAATALLELRERRPEAGCGCFGDLSTTPVGSRQILRAALLAFAGLSSVGAPPLRLPPPGAKAFASVGIVLAELLLIAALSPEISLLLVRLGYSAPCELRAVAGGRALAWLRRSRAWRRHAGLITSETPADMWRELCWWYVVYPGRAQGKPVDVVFAVRISPRRPAVKAAVVPGDPGGGDSPSDPASRLTSADF